MHLLAGQVSSLEKNVFFFFFKLWLPLILIFKADAPGVQNSRQSLAQGRCLVKCTGLNWQSLVQFRDVSS